MLYRPQNSVLLGAATTCSWNPQAIAPEFLHWTVATLLHRQLSVSHMRFYLHLLSQP